VQTLSLIEVMLSYEPLNRPSVQMIIEKTEEMIMWAKAAQTQQGAPQAVKLEAELDNRYQFMLIEKYSPKEEYNTAQ
jgi:hypothetical protein